jgi:hypothetical protein
LLVKTGSDEVTVKESHHPMAYMAHQAERLADDPRECLKDLDCGTEAVCQLPISLTIFLERFCSILEELEDHAGRV